MNYPEREWPNKQIEKAPEWVSVDLRDGNQALIDPMVVSEKMDMFRLLVKLGFKQIEIGFPAASQIEYEFLRELKLLMDTAYSNNPNIRMLVKQMVSTYHPETHQPHKEKTA